MKPNILLEDRDILVCRKPAGVPVQSDKTLDYDLVNQLKNYLHEKEENKFPYIGLVHRLDRPVGGVMVFAKTPQAAKELSKQIQEKKMEKTYLCVVQKDLSEQVGRERTYLEDYIRKDGRTNTSVIVPKSDKAGKCAQLYYRVLEVVDGNSLVEIRLLTGRHHQIRVQMAAHVGGLVGDTKYNPLATREQGRKGVALFSNSLRFLHPKTKKTIYVTDFPEGELWDCFTLPFENVEV